MLQSYALLVGRDEQRSSSSFAMWRVDPTGQFWKCDAAAIGRRAGVAEAHLLDLVVARSEEMDDKMALFFYRLSARQALSIACECIKKALPKEKESHWQALMLRPSGPDDQQVVTRVWNGKYLHALLNSTTEMDTDSGEDEVV